MEDFDAPDKQYLLLKEAQVLEPVETYFQRFLPLTEQLISSRHVPEIGITSEPSLRQTATKGPILNGIKMLTWDIL